MHGELEDFYIQMTAKSLNIKTCVVELRKKITGDFLEINSYKKKHKN